MDNKKSVKRNIILGILVFALSIGAMVVSFANITNVGLDINDVSEKAKLHIFFVYLFLSLLQIPFYFQRKESKGAYRYLVYSIVYFISCILIAIFHSSLWVFSLTSLIFFASLMFGRVASIIHRRTVRYIILNSMLLFILSILSLVVFTKAVDKSDNLLSTIFVAGVTGIVTLSYILKEAFYRIKFAKLKKILRRTYVFEILLGLVSLIISFSFLFTTFEDISYGDALWYCFSVVTTIGFGDIVVESILSRILAVILGLYGLIVVAVITSVIVNFYNESKDTLDNKVIGEDKTNNIESPEQKNTQLENKNED